VVGKWWEGWWGTCGKGGGELVGKVVRNWWEGWWAVGDIGYKVGVNMGRGRVCVDKRRGDRDRDRDRDIETETERQRETENYGWHHVNTNFCVNNNFLST
jgi:hypothetical protein